MNKQTFIFYATKEDVGFSAYSKDCPVVTQGDDHIDLCDNILEAVACFMDSENSPSKSYKIYSSGFLEITVECS